MSEFSVSETMAELDGLQQQCGVKGSAGTDTVGGFPLADIASMIAFFKAALAFYNTHPELVAAAKAFIDFVKKLLNPPTPEPNNGGVV